MDEKSGSESPARKTEDPVITKTSKSDEVETTNDEQVESSMDNAEAENSETSDTYRQEDKGQQNGDINEEPEKLESNNNPPVSEKENDSSTPKPATKEAPIGDSEPMDETDNAPAVANGDDFPDLTNEVIYTESISPGKVAILTNPRFSLTKGPRAKMTLSPNKAPPSKSIAHYFQAMTKASARKSLSGSFTDKSGDNKSIKAGSEIDDRDSAKDAAAMKKALDIALGDKVKSAQVIEESSQKRQPKARKSFQPRNSSSRESTPLSIRSNSSTPSGVSIANMTYKVPELESALGIKRRTLDKIDAKTLDQIVLAKASKMVSPAPNSYSLGTSSPNSRSLLKPLHQILAESAQKKKINVEQTEPANISAVITSQKILKKRKKRRKPKLGTYKLPGAKKDYKKKLPGKEKEKVKSWNKRYMESGKTNKATNAGQGTKLGSGSKTEVVNGVLSDSSKDDRVEPDDQVNAEMDDKTSQDPSETDDSYAASDKASRKKKAGKSSKWKRGCLPSKKAQRKARSTSKSAVYKKVEPLAVKKEENPLLRDALRSTVREPSAELQTLNQVIANLSEDAGNSAGLRRSGRKRKAIEQDDVSSVTSSGTEVESEAGPHKKRKIEVVVDTGPGVVKQIQVEISKPPSLSPETVKPVTLTIPSDDQSSPPTISPQRTPRASSKLPPPKPSPKSDNHLSKNIAVGRSTSKSRSPEQKVHTHGIGAVAGFYKRKLHEGELAAVPSAAQRHKQVEGATVHKYVNTPNGLSYPVTPPVTPDNSVAEEKTGEVVGKYEGGDKDRDFIPLCCCKVTGNSYTNSKQVMYCQALDSIHGKVVGCCNRVSNKQLMRPAIKVPFMAVCEVHRQRMKQHQCCPGCGHFCTEGKFFQCRKDSHSRVVHYFHRQCQVFKDNKYYCPHCGEESLQFEVTLRLSEQQIKDSFLLRDEPKPKPLEILPLSSRARMSVERPHDVRKSGSEEKAIAISAGNGKKISTAGLVGPEKDDLAAVIAVLEGDKTKKLRMGPKTLYGASKVGDLEKVLYMLVEGVDPNTKFEDYGNQTALHAAAEGGSLLVAHMLIQAEASPHAIDDDLRTPLMNAAEQGHVEVMKLLIKCGAHVQMKAEDGMTALHLAAKSGKTGAVRYLVSTKLMDVNVADDGGWTPIIWSAEHRHIDTVKYLVEAGADPNLKDNEENTGLHWAAFAGSVDIAELFLNAGCAIEGANMHGDRPLHIASRQDHYECVVLFLARGADCEARNNDNEAPLSCCVDKESQCWMALRVNVTLKGIAAQRVNKPEALLHRDISMGRETNGIPVVNSVDDANYPQDFLYVSDYVETSPINVNRVITSLQSCKCRDNCTSVFCVCGRNSIRCWYEADGRLVNDFNFSDPPLVFECNKACRCWSTCQNRVVQLGVTCRLQVFRTDGRGWGARTLLDIPQGAFVCEYIGELITDAEADSREDDSYLFDLDNKDADTFCIDARKYGNISRFVNHLCEPNLTPVKVFVDHQDLRFPRICFFASRDIKAHEELGFDYGEKFWIIKWKQFTCTCGSPKCRYSKEKIHTTLEEYNRRQEEELAASQA